MNMLMLCLFLIVEPYSSCIAKKKIGYREELMEVGRIEVIMNSLNPMWIQKINLAFHFEIVQPLVCWT
ncbi:hypothetical protein HanLR1_Chr08g0287221 [Helianthus annuus]|nr:hypothetical protein HanLR1_Chr08g0287221 [Helianthus annuus]